MSIYFYENDKDENKLYFHLERASMVQRAEPFVFDGPATDRHKKDYSEQLEQFLKSKEPAIKEEVEEKENGFFKRKHNK